MTGPQKRGALLRVALRLWGDVRATVQALRFGVCIYRGASLPTVGILLLSSVAGLDPAIRVLATQHLLNALAAIHNHRLPDAVLLGPLLPWLGLMVGAQLLVSSVNAVAPLASAYVNERTTLNLKRWIYSKALRLGLAAFEKPDMYDRQARALGAVGSGHGQTLDSVRTSISALLGLLGILVYVAHVSLLLALGLCANAIYVVRTHKRVSREWEQIHYGQSPLERKLDYWRSLSTQRDAAAELRLFGLGSYFLARWTELARQRMDAFLATRYRLDAYELRVNWVTGIVNGFVIGWIIYAVVVRSISIGTMVALLYALHEFDQLRISFGFQFGNLVLFEENLRRIREFLGADGEEIDADAAVPHPLQDGIVFERVSFTYPGSERPALSRVNLHIRPGERIALVGANGAGKSTLARLLLGLYTPTEGRILVDGVDLAQIDPTCWRKRTAAVFQDFMRYHLTVRENIGFGDLERMEVAELVASAAQKSGADSAISALAAGHDTLLGKGFEGAADLSPGQWQSLALARAYLREAEILVLDEPTASLDALAELAVYEQFRDIADGRTALLISHRLGSARLADRIVLLDEGSVAQIGSHEELLARGGCYAAMYALQAAWYQSSGAESASEPDDEPVC